MGRRGSILISRSRSHRRFSIENALVTRAIGVALACFLLQSTLLPLFGAPVGAWSASHAHISLDGTVPAHRHPWQADDSPGPSCVPGEASGSETATAPTVLCTNDTNTSTDAGTPALPVHLVVTAGPSAIETALPERAAESRTGFTIPIVLPPPIA